MKARHVMLPVTFAFFVAVGGQIATAGGSGNPPLPTGQFSNIATGSLAVCLDPTTFAFESCSAKGVLILPLSFSAAGLATRDKNGACVSRTNVASSLPPNAQPPIVDSKVHELVKITDYDPATGVGDASFTNYDGGQCIGAKFDSTGATVTGSGTEHFVVSKGGNRIDVITITLTNSTDSIGSFSFNSVDLKQ